MNILLITDDTSIISMVKHSLREISSSDRLFTARSGREGIEILNKSLNSQLDLVPGLIIIDFDSAEANALYVLQRVTTDLKIQGSQVAVLTSPLEPSDAEFLERLDLEYIIEKPIEHKTLQEFFHTIAADYDGTKRSSLGATPYSPAPRSLDEEELRAVIERAPMVMLRIDQTFCIKDCNETFSKATKQLRHALIGRHVFDILPDLEVLPMISVLEDAIPYSRDGYRMKTIGQSHSATTYWDFHVWSIRKMISSGAEAILIATDVSGRVELEQQRERFVAALAHDIRNPVLGGQRVLDSILGGRHGELQPPRAKQLIGALHKSNQNLLLMLTNLIDVYKFETASMALDFQLLDLRDLLTEQISEVSYVAAASEIVFKVDFADELPKISGDINSIRRLLSNLFHNALKYCVPKSEIEVRAWSFGSRVSIRICNKGNPIATEKLASLFRTVLSGVPMKHGSGLGLYLCRRIVEAHHARLDCTTSIEQGTVFTVHFNAGDTDANWNQSAIS